MQGDWQKLSITRRDSLKAKEAVAKKYARLPLYKLEEHGIQEMLGKLPEESYNRLLQVQTLRKGVLMKKGILFQQVCGRHMANTKEF